MVRVIDKKMIFTRIFLITVCVVLVSSMTSQIREISSDQKRSPFSGRCHYRPTNMINECCPVTKPKDCRDIDPAHCKSGVYTIYPVGTRSFDVYCKLINQGKAWTVIQTRFNGQIIFNRTWKDDEYGFGNINGEHWLGLKCLSYTLNYVNHSCFVHCQEAIRKRYHVIPNATVYDRH